MALDPSNSINLEQLVLKGLILANSKTVLLTNFRRWSHNVSVLILLRKQAAFGPWLVKLGCRVEVENAYSRPFWMALDFLLAK